ncbi:MAG: acylneuraminate cytidylyltransferase family protein [Oscillospiraceae bacterium]
MDILVTVLARAGSKGVKSKNMRTFLDYPIAYYTLSALDLFKARYSKEYGAVDLAVNTDADELFEQIDKTKLSCIKVPRTLELAGDRVSKIDVVRDTLAKAEKVSHKKYDMVVDMDLTSPLRRARDVKNVIDSLMAHKNAEIALSVTPARRNPYFNQLALMPDGLAKTPIESDFVARQQAPEIFDANASLYAYRPQFLASTDTILIKSKLCLSVMPDTAVLDIDSEHDFELMQILARYFFESDEE